MAIKLGLNSATINEYISNVYAALGHFRGAADALDTAHLKEAERMA